MNATINKDTQDTTFMFSWSRTTVGMGWMNDRALMNQTNYSVDPVNRRLKLTTQTDDSH